MGIVQVELLVTATVWICDFCGRDSIHKAGTGSPLWAEHFIDRLRWSQLGEEMVACDRCSLLVPEAHQMIAAS